MDDDWLSAEDDRHFEKENVKIEKELLHDVDAKHMLSV